MIWLGIRCCEERRVPGPARPTAEVGVGLAWTITSLKGLIVEKGAKKWSRVHSRAYLLCSLSSTPTIITCFSIPSAIVVVVATSSEALFWSIALDSFPNCLQSRKNKEASRLIVLYLFPFRENIYDVVDVKHVATLRRIAGWFVCWVSLFPVSFFRPIIVAFGIIRRNFFLILNCLVSVSF